MRANGGLPRTSGSMSTSKLRNRGSGGPASFKRLLVPIDATLHPQPPVGVRVDATSASLPARLRDSSMLSPAVARAKPKASKSRMADRTNSAPASGVRMTLMKTMEECGLPAEEVAHLMSSTFGNAGAQPPAKAVPQAGLVDLTLDMDGMGQATSGAMGPAVERRSGGHDSKDARHNEVSVNDAAIGPHQDDAFERELLALSSYCDVRPTFSAGTAAASRPSSGSFLQTQVISRPASGAHTSVRGRPHTAARRDVIALEYASALEERLAARHQRERDEERKGRETIIVPAYSARVASAQAAAKASEYASDSWRWHSAVQALESRIKASETAASTFYDDMSRRIDEMGKGYEHLINEDPLAGIDARLVAILAPGAEPPAAQAGCAVGGQADGRG